MGSPGPTSRPDLAPLSVALEVVATGLEEPIFITHAGDARRFVVERPGRIRILDHESLRATPFLDITSLVNPAGEGGLLRDNAAGNWRAVAAGPRGEGDCAMLEFLERMGLPLVAVAGLAVAVWTVRQILSLVTQQKAKLAQDVHSKMLQMRKPSQ